jgi:hydrogenase maturation protein HypF
MFPTTALHALLLEDFGRPLVCTSGNRSEEPLCTESGEALGRLGSIADGFLVHDRAVLRPLDDSVGRVDRGTFRVARRARGLSPRALKVAGHGPTVLALGAQLKSSTVLLTGDSAIPSQHLGDLGTVESNLRLENTVFDMIACHGVKPEVIACDPIPPPSRALSSRALASPPPRPRR